MSRLPFSKIIIVSYFLQEWWFRYRELSRLCVSLHSFIIDNCLLYMDSPHKPAIYLRFTALVYLLLSLLPRHKLYGRTFSVQISSPPPCWFCATNKRFRSNMLNILLTYINILTYCKYLYSIKVFKYINNKSYQLYFHGQLLWYFCNRPHCHHFYKSGKNRSYNSWDNNNNDSLIAIILVRSNAWSITNVASYFLDKTGFFNFNAFKAASSQSVIINLLIWADPTARPVSTHLKS